MSLYVLVIVLTAAVLHATLNLLAKKTNGKTPFIWLLYAISNILYLPFLFFHKVTDSIVYSQAALWFSLSSAVLHLVYFIVLQKGYRSADLSVVYPLARGSGPLFSSIAAILFLHEALKLTSTLGLFLIIGGVLIITGLSFNKENNSKIKTGMIYGVLIGQTPEAVLGWTNVAKNGHELANHTLFHACPEKLGWNKSVAIETYTVDNIDRN